MGRKISRHLFSYSTPLLLEPLSKNLAKMLSAFSKGNSSTQLELAYPCAAMGEAG